MEELLDTYDKLGNFVGVQTKTFCHSKNPGVYYKPVWIWIINSDNKILLQKRASTKKYFPDKWDHSIGGHVKAGEDNLSACQRETLEEIGLLFEKEKFIFIGEFLEQIYWHIGQVYILKEDIDILGLKIDKNEVGEIRWFSFEEFKNLIFSDSFGPFELGYKNWIVEKLELILK